LNGRKEVPFCVEGGRGGWMVGCTGGEKVKRGGEYLQYKNNPITRRVLF